MTTSYPANANGRAPHPAAATSPALPPQDQHTERLRVRRSRFSGRVRAIGPAARQLVLDVVPRHGRERDSARAGEWLVFGSHLDKLVSTARAAGLDVDDRAVGRR